MEQFRSIKFVLSLCLLALSVPIHAQWNGPRGSHHGTVHSDTPSIVKEYTDSLSALKERLLGDSAAANYVVDRIAKAQSIIAPLFIPPTFYKEKVGNAFGETPTTTNPWMSLVNQTMIDLYLNHPERVLATGSQLKQKGNKMDKILSPIQTEPTIGEEPEAKPLEPNITKLDIAIHKPNFWTYRGDYSLQFMQNYVSGNWYKGGESNYSALGAISVEANYNNKQKVKWDNKLELKFGMQSSRSDSLHSFKTTEDLIRLTSKLGLQATKKWYYTLQFIGYTQFTHSYKANDATLYSDFLAPLNLNLSLGMDYTVDWLNHKLKGTIHLAPLAYNMKYTKIRSLASRLGIDEDKRFLNDFGSEFTVDLEWKLMENLLWKTRLYGYTTYERAELEWENTFTLTFNRYISAKLFIYPRFDDGGTRDDHHGYMQFKEYLSLGFNYTF